MRTMRLPLSAALALLSLGCGKPPAPPAAPPPPSPAAPAPDVFLTTEDNRVKVPRPRGDGWDCVAKRVFEASVGVRASFVTCRIEASGGRLTLMAKDYEVPPRAVASAEHLATVEYPQHYRKRWDIVDYKRSAPVDHHGHQGWEVEIALSSVGGPKVVVLERVVVSGRNTVNLSAEGPADAVSQHAAEIKRWFDGSDFAALKSELPGKTAWLALGRPEE